MDNLFNEGFKCRVHDEHLNVELTRRARSLKWQRAPLGSIPLPEFVTRRMLVQASGEIFNRETV